MLASSLPLSDSPGCCEISEKAKLMNTQYVLPAIPWKNKKIAQTKKIYQNTLHRYIYYIATFIIYLPKNKFLKCPTHNVCSLLSNLLSVHDFLHFDPMLAKKRRPREKEW